MPEQPAARVGDMIMCPMQTPTPLGPVPHAVGTGMPIIPPGCPTVMINNQPAARIGDKSICIAPLPFNPITRGAFPALIGGQPAARMTDQCTHPGSSISPPCCPTVLIGQAGTSGNPWAGNEQCQAAAAGRNPPPGATGPDGNQLPPNTPGQSYNNCGVESSRQIINQANGLNVTQEGLLNQAMNNGWANQVPGNLWASGGTRPAQRVSILAANGVPATTMAPNIQNIELAVSQGRGVISSVWAARLWPANVATSSGLVPGSATGGHAIVVTGVEYDADGNIVNVIVNDTGLGSCSQPIPAAQFQNSLKSDINVTDNPIW